MARVEIVFGEVLPRVGHLVSFLYRVMVDGKMVRGALKVSFIDDFLSKYRIPILSGPDPVKFDAANQALLSEIGRMLACIQVVGFPLEEIEKRCTDLGEKPLTVINSKSFSERTVDDILDNLRRYKRFHCKNCGSDFYAIPGMEGVEIGDHCELTGLTYNKKPVAPNRCRLCDSPNISIDANGGT